jgi:hypothetical protein
MSTSNPFEVAFANQELHADLCEQLEQIRDRKTSDDYIKREAALIITNCQEPLLEIIDAMEKEVKDLRECIELEDKILRTLAMPNNKYDLYWEDSVELTNFLYEFDYIRHRVMDKTHLRNFILGMRI